MKLTLSSFMHNLPLFLGVAWSQVILNYLSTISGPELIDSWAAAFVPTPSFFPALGGPGQGWPGASWTLSPQANRSSPIFFPELAGASEERLHHSPLLC
jgi:hypothetical protein